MKSFISMLILGVSLTASANQPRGYDRFEIHLRQLDKILHITNDPGDAIDELMDRDARRILLKLEGLARIYKIQYEDFDPIYDKIKKLNDSFGRYLDTNDYYEFADKIRVPISALGKLKTALDESKNSLSIELTKTWLPDHNGVSGAEDLMGALNDLEWDSNALDRKLILDSFKRDIKKVIDTKYDMDQLQSGVYELRRRLRWFSVYVMSTDGMIGIRKPVDENRLPDWERLIRKMDWSGDENPFVSFSFERFSSLTYAISFLGELKDQGEYLNAVLTAMGGSSESRDWILARMREIGMPIRDVSKEAKVLYADLKKNQLLEALYKELR